MGKIVGGAGLGEKMENLFLAVLHVKFKSHMGMLRWQSHHPRAQAGRSTWREECRHCQNVSEN